MAGHLYQLKVPSPHVGEYVKINGPWDTYGRVVALHSDGEFHLIRGIGKTLPAGVDKKQLKQLKNV